MRIRFTQETVYEMDGPNKGPKFPAGFVLDASGVQAALGLAEAPKKEWAENFLSRWLRREVAETVDNRVKVSPIEDMNRPARPPEPPPVPAAPVASAKPDYAAMSDEALIALIKQRGVDVGDARTREDVIAALQLADEQN